MYRQEKSGASSSYDQLSDHEYDGIREYDNPTPGWWHMIFWASIFFSVFYVMIYHVGGAGRSIHDRYEQDVTAYYEKLFADVGDLEPDEQTILRVMYDPEFEQFQPVAKAVFTAKCAQCHGASGQGGTGPNMTDDSYKNVKVLTDIAKVIREGAATGAMPTWEGRLHPNHIVLLAGYIASLRGQNLPGKAPEGDQAAPWPDPPAEFGSTP